MNPGRGGARDTGLEVKPGRAMRALAELLRRQDLDPFALFDAALELLVRQFMVDHALITRLSNGQQDTFWWVHAGAGAREPLEVHQSLRLCERVIQEPEGSLAFGTVSASEGGAGLRAFAGVVLLERGKRIGTLCVIHSSPFVFTPEDLDFIRAVGGLLGRALEIESLKFELAVAQDSLALSTAVVQDSALESPATGLPNARFLEIWIKGHMHHARRQKETLSLAVWEDGRGAKAAKGLLAVAKLLRGEDLLVELSATKFLMLLPKTLQEGAQVILDRVHPKLGSPPVGATLWLPDQDDLQLRTAQRRAELARQEALQGGGGIRWKLPTEVALES